MLLIDADDLDLDFVALLVGLALLGAALPRDLADVDEAVHGADGDEQAEAGLAVDNAVKDVADVDFFVELGARSGQFFVKQAAARQDEAALALVLLEQADGEPG